MEWLIQIILLASLIICITLGLIIFNKLLKTEKGTKLFTKFIVVETLFFIAAVSFFLIILGAKLSISGLIIVSVLVAGLLNIPAIIIIKIFSLFQSLIKKS